MGIVSPSGAIVTLGTVYDTTYAGGVAGLRTRGASASFDGVRVSGG